MENLKIGSIVELDICDLGYSGEGVSKTFGIPVFVNGALVGEKVEVNIKTLKSNFAVGELVSVKNKSKDRVKAPCPYFNKCGGCVLQHLKYNEQLNYKQTKVENAFWKIANIKHEVCETVPSNESYNYRNKISFAVRDINNTANFILYEEGTNEKVVIEKCLIVGDWANEILTIVKKWMTDNKISPYNEKTHNGDIRHVVARNLNNQIQIVIVTNGQEFPCKQNLYKDLTQKFEIVSLWQNLNMRDTSLIFTENFKHCFGSKEILASISNLEIKILPQSFMQINDEIRDKIYSETLALIEKNDIVIDAYSGAGLLTALIAKQTTNKVYGIEIVREATNSANELKAKYNLTNMQNINGDCDVELPKLMKQGKFKENNLTLVLDPPRKGVDKSVMLSISEIKPNKIIYISCDEATLARDIKILFESAANAYEIKLIKPFDMFPQTKHIETLVCLIRKN